jgi:prolyl-tRNA synthetase
VIVPIYKTDEERTTVLEAVHRIGKSLGAWDRREPARLRIHIDARDGMKPGAKYYEWELKGIPLRLEIGPRDLAANQGVLVRRDTRQKRPVSLGTLGEDVVEVLQTMQREMLATALDRREAHSVRERISYDRFRELMDGPGGFVYAGWCSDAACEAQIKEETKATIRCLPDEEFRSADAPTTCLKCGRPSIVEALWAKAY